MNLTHAQQRALEHLKLAYLGPEGGDDEVTFDPPSLRYTVGMLFPGEGDGNQPDDIASTPDSFQYTSADVISGEIEEDDSSNPLAEDWRPSSTAISFVTDTDSIFVDFSAATYQESTDDGPRRWTRYGQQINGLLLSQTNRLHKTEFRGVPLELGTRWRPYKGHWLVTLHVRLLTQSTGDVRDDISLMLFQVELSGRPAMNGKLLPYDSSSSIDSDEEAGELRLRYRSRQFFGVGHGMAADWELDEDDNCVRVFLDPVPHYVVSDIEQTGLRKSSSAAQALELEFLETIDKDPGSVAHSLRSFVEEFETWVVGQEQEAESLGLYAQNIASRSRKAVVRMREGIDYLCQASNSRLRTAFSLGMSAMKLQMEKARPGKKAMWRPFQLGFLLVAIESSTDELHSERDLVDLIWFPTGGGKTEAYLAIAAITIFLRRLVHGVQGAGTAVITRYTLRLLTAQQFQRAASLICAMELMRSRDERVRGMARFSIGLWVGNEVTPGTRADAKFALERLLKAANPREANMFQITECPWCLSKIVPEDKGETRDSYGIRLVGKDVIFTCLNAACEFSSRELPMSVVDEMIYEEPPTFLLATVDKFARLQFNTRAGRILGINTAFKQPSLIIQDELHLLSGPLGTTVAVFDAVIQLLLRKTGISPKVIASTATIRASSEQVKGLYGREVALYPPAGLDGETTFFARPVSNGFGRMYLGLMPQSLPQATALVAATAPFLEIPQVLDKAEGISLDEDSYWTLVMYHNSLRELGRTSSLLLDDVNGRLEARADRLDFEFRHVGAAAVLELTSRRGPDELPGDLRQLALRKNESKGVIDVVLSSNMLSVGIDVQRLALMLMVGQPKTTAEYIQATSRVGRGDTHGIVGTLFRSNRARDRSHFETFRSYHEVLYKNVEPTSVTPWSLSSRRRSLAGALVALFRHTFPSLSGPNDAINFDLQNDSFMTDVTSVVNDLLDLIERADRSELGETRIQIWSLLNQWDELARNARESGEQLGYERNSKEGNALLKRFEQPGRGWLVADSMRSVEPNVAVEVEEPFQEVARAKN